MKKEMFKSKTDNGCVAHTIIEVIKEGNNKMVCVTQKILVPINECLFTQYYPFSKIASRVINGKVIVMNRMVFWDLSFRNVIKAYKSLSK